MEYVRNLASRMYVQNDLFILQSTTTTRLDYYCGYENLEWVQETDECRNVRLAEKNLGWFPFLVSKNKILEKHQRSKIYHAKILLPVFMLKLLPIAWNHISISMSDKQLLHAICPPPFFFQRSSPFINWSTLVLNDYERRRVHTVYLSHLLPVQSIIEARAVLFT